ncbi:competence/damage-inducible protein A [Litchfieldia salsa]|uniref:Putative competence-damage inducible protein n=1 Tax=Litchfieldia salsa TaxID=930152 RepID=A0A1H0R206_9BACI|nr:competence/damage-inducible protein A [Litchfieldia salsa]SDP23571.1 nicotinamide-nucleotide amidase [Litchfieldia salsa]
MNAEIIAVGSELLLGQIVNSNAQFLSKKLAEIGVNVYYHTVVGDNPNRLTQAIKVAQQRSELIIFTGGLGPTKDDLTKETIANLLDKRLVSDDYALQGIEQYFKQVDRVMTENNKKQALILEGSTVLQNDYGMAPGMGIQVDDITYMLLPGPPKEMNPMFISYGQDYLLKQLGEIEHIDSRVLRFFGIGESSLETEIVDLIDQQTNPTIAPLASDGEVTLRLTAKHKSLEHTKVLLDQLEEKITDRVGEFLYGYEDSSLVEEAMKIMIEKKLTIASAESLTGGQFSQELTNIAGASKVFSGSIVCYSNEVKEKVLQVNKKILETDGAVSEACAKSLAENVKSIVGSDIGISFTGVAGPDESEGKSVGTVYIGLAIKDLPTKVFSLKLAGTRSGIRSRSVKYGFYYIQRELN